MASKKKGLDFKNLVRDEVTGDLPEQFLKWLEVEKHYSPNTVYQYRCDLKLIDDYSKAIKKVLQDLSYQNLFSYLRILKEKKGYLFLSLRGRNRHGKTSVRSIQRVVAKYRKELSLPEKFTPHKGRHTFLSRLIQQGVDISIAGKLAGHANLQTTMGYLTFRDEDIRAAVDKL